MSLSTRWMLAGTLLVVFTGVPSLAGEDVDDLTPMARPVWSIPAPNDVLRQRMIQKQRRDLIQSGQPPIPAAVPLVVAAPTANKPDENRQLIVIRSLNRLLMVDAATGIRIAVHPPLSEFASTVGRRRTPPSDELIRRVTWQDNATGMLVAESDILYCATQRIAPAVENPDFSDDELCALNVPREGARQWSIGGKEGGDEPKLAGARFLGKPLVSNKRLIALIEQERKIRLIQLDRRTGRLRHAIDCLDLNADRAAGLDPASLEPIESRTRIICTLPGGTIVGVDKMDTSIKWRYALSDAARADAAGPFIVAARPPDRLVLNSLHVIGDALIVGRPGSGRLVCLGVDAGELRWETKHEFLYAADVGEDTIITVCKQEIAAHTSASGELRWRVKLPADAMPSGRGWRHGRRYYLPTTASELVQFDLETGKILARTELGEPMGNLVLAGKRMISYDGAQLRCYALREVVDRQAKARLEADPKDAWAVARRGELLLQDGKPEEALRILRQSLAIESADDTRLLIVSATLRLLREDPARHANLARDAAELVTSPSSRIEFWRLLAEGHSRRGEPAKALDCCQRLIKELRRRRQALPANVEPILIEVEPGRKVSIERWLQAMMGDLQRELAQERDSDLP